MATDASPHSPHSPQRLLALDWLRGLVMVLMAVDHCDGATNPHHAQGDAVWMPGALPLRAGDFLTRWATHLCAPTFVFLCGAGMALSVARAQGRGEAPRAIDRHWLLRGAVLLVLEVTLMSFYWRFEQPADVILQVLYAIGGGIVLMVPLRRLPVRALWIVALLLPVATELCFQPLQWGAAGLRAAPMWNGLLFSGGIYQPFGLQVFAIYPLLPWLTPMLLGFLFGRWLARGPDPAMVARSLLRWGLAALLGFALVRSANGFGNAQLLRRGDAVLEWLHGSKYPPSLSFLLLELGLMALLLAALVAIARRRDDRPPRFDPLLVIGQVPLFFYLLHLPILGALVYGSVFPRPGGWPRSWLMALVVAGVALPLCALYRRHKQRARGGWTRYL